MRALHSGGAPAAISDRLYAFGIEVRQRQREPAGKQPLHALRQAAADQRRRRQAGQRVDGVERRKLADERARLAGEDPAPRRPEPPKAERERRGPKH